VGARAATERLRATEGVGRVVSVLDLVPENQDGALDLIEEAALFLALDGGGTTVEPPGQEEVWELLEGLQGDLSDVVRSDGGRFHAAAGDPAALGRAKEALATAVARLDSAKVPA